jgi:hypothetical protein
MRFTTEQDTTIKTLYAGGKDVQEIADALKTNIKHVITQVVRLGLAETRQEVRGFKPYDQRPKKDGENEVQNLMRQIITLQINLSRAYSKLTNTLVANQLPLPK